MNGSWIRNGAAVAVVLALTGAGLAARTLDARAGTSAGGGLWQPDRASLDDGTNHFLVTVRGQAGGAGDPAAVAALATVGSVTHVSGPTYAVHTTEPQAQVEALGGVTSVVDDLVVDVADAPGAGTAAAPNDPLWAQQWGLTSTEANLAWTMSRGAGVTVAVVDTGIQTDHPDLAGSMWHNPGEICGNGIDDDHNGYVDDCDGWDFANNDNTPYDPSSDNSHGTHVAGIIAAQLGNAVGGSGIAPAAKIMPLKAGNSGSFSSSALALAIDYATANGAKIINASWGSSGHVQPLDDAIRRAEAAGVLFVAASGNASANTDVTPFFPAALPDDGIVSVGSIDSAGNPSSFSNYGATTVDLFAPGSSILSTYPGSGYATMSGTSMATPFVVGSAALIWSLHPSWTALQVKQALLFAAVRGSALSGKAVSSGRLDAAQAVGGSGLPVEQSFAGFDAFQADQAHAATVHTTLSDPSAAPAGTSLTWRITLATESGGRAYAVAGHDLVWSAGGTSGVATTGDDGSALVATPAGLPVGAGADLALTQSLPAGQYALMAELVDPSGAVPSTIGNASAVFFSVAAPDSPPATPPTTVVVPTPGPSPTTPSPTPTTPAPTTPTPITPTPGTPAPTTPAPQPPTTPGPTTSTTRPTSPAPTSPAPTSPTPTTSPRTPSPTPTTTAPSTPSPSPTTTTVPSGPPATSPAPRPPTATFGLSSIQPGSGSPSGDDTVVVNGLRIPARARVSFGGRPAQVLVDWAPTQLVVITPAHTAGTVDVVVTGPDGTTDTLTGGFTFGSATPAPGPTPTTPAPTTPAPTTPITPTTAAPRSPTSPTTPPVTSPAPTTPPTSAPPTTGPAPTPTTSPAPTPTTVPVPGAPVRVPLPNGLTGVALGASSRLAGIAPGGWPAMRCQSSSCPGVLL